MAYATVEELARALRITVTPENSAGLQACLDAAAAEIDHEIDRKPGTVASANWTFAAQIAEADPGAGFMRLDHAQTQAAQAAYLSDVDQDGADWGTLLDSLTANDLMQLTDAANPYEWVRYAVTGPSVDNATWHAIPVAFHSDGARTIDFAAAIPEGTVLQVQVLRPATLMVQNLALANRVNIVRGVEWAKANDAAFGVIGFDQSGALTAPRDGFNRHAYTLTPLKAQFGLA